MGIFFTSFKFTFEQADKICNEQMNSGDVLPVSVSVKMPLI